MATTYDDAKPATLERLAKIMADHHGELAKVGVQVGVLVADNLLESPVKGYGGLPAAAKISIVSLKDRVKKRYDAELILDARFLDESAQPVIDAVLDHELTHLQLVFDKKKFTVKYDDLGRPKLKLRDEDFGVWGFWEIIQRHGDACQEVRGWTATEAAARKKKLDLSAPGLLTSEPEPEAEAPAAAKPPVPAPLLDEAEPPAENSGFPENRKTELPPFTRVATGGWASGQAQLGNYSLVIGENFGYLYGPDPSRLLDIAKAHDIDNAKIAVEEPGVVRATLDSADAARLADACANAAEWREQHQTAVETPTAKARPRKVPRAAKRRAKGAAGATA